MNRPTSSAGAAPQLDGLLARRQLHLILALDCSGSMRGDRIASLNYALRSAIPELQQTALENPEVNILVRVLRFSTGARWHFEEAQPIATLEWSDLTADGETHMGAALSMIARALSPEQLPGRQLPPVLVLVSDGFPSDDFDEGLAALFAQDIARSAIRLGIAIGADADLETLEAFIDHPTLQPLRANNASDLVQHIKWATTAPVKAASSPTTAPDPLARLASDQSMYKTDDQSIVW
jgi:uncharacterized protein YegL